MVLALVSATMLASCSGRDPATEEPVTPLAGEYLVSIEAGGAIGALTSQREGPGSEPRTICVTESDRERFVQNVLNYAGSLHPGCVHSAAPRGGNAVSGTYSCPTDPQRAPGGRFAVTYTGVISEDAVDATMDLKIELPAAALAALSPEEREQMRQGQELMESIPIAAKARRQGDCGA